ncbi:hypothetical protein HELRODRAFT_174842 [Helobdella robusta]|uniref:Uncharacterized protein n=1 Tax=Helobdella robusta TaxID=6412 RepID=T1F8J2_HELRO|nr:hypothetical protein HELRODRAFT_174842 [Helobdella robusta]ESO01292.1 hypothetical protein HELRODRAFT_174842 [Helobdella robusta]
MPLSVLLLFLLMLLLLLLLLMLLILCPWLIRASEGQQMTLTLIEVMTSQTFPSYSLAGGNDVSEAGDGGGVVIQTSDNFDDGVGEVLLILIIEFFLNIRKHLNSNQPCMKYGIVKEVDRDDSDHVTICGLTTAHNHYPSIAQRRRVIYKSRGHALEVIVQSHVQRFLLHFQATGCPILAAPANGWAEMESRDVLVTGCNNTNSRRVHRCVGNTWTDGDVINCPESPGILFVSAIGVSLGLVIGVSLLFIVVVCLKRYRVPPPPSSLRHPAVSYDPANQLEDIYQHHYHHQHLQQQQQQQSQLDSPLFSNQLISHQTAFNQSANGADYGPANSLMSFKQALPTSKFEMIPMVCFFLMFNDY